MRGEGGRLYNPRTGKRYMEFYDPTRMELAPRDVVARAIGNEPVAPEPLASLVGARDSSVPIAATPDALRAVLLALS